MIELVRDYVIPQAYAVLPKEMQSREATGMLLAIGLQESRFLHRRQLPNGPARGFWQFERSGGVHGVLSHPSTAEHARTVLKALRYPYLVTFESEGGIWEALEHNDVLACCFARLLLWTLPDPLPTAEQSDEGWRQYLAAWRPGRPHVSSWPTFFTEAFHRVTFADFRRLNA